MSFHNRMRFHSERIPHRPDNQQHFQNRMPPQPDNRFRGRFPVEDRFRFPVDQRPPLIHNQLPFESNRLPYQDNKNSLKIPDANRWGNSCEVVYPFQSLQSNSQMLLPVNHGVPPPSDEKPNYYDNNMQKLPDNRLNCSSVTNPRFQESVRMPCHSHLSTEESIRFPFVTHGLPTQGNQKFPLQNVEHRDGSQSGINNNQIYQNNTRFPKVFSMNEGLTPPNHKGISCRPFTQFHPIPLRPQVGISNFHARPIQMNPIHSQPTMHHPISVLPLQPNLNVNTLPHNTQMLPNLRLPAQNQMQISKDSQLIPKMKVPPIPNHVAPNIRFPPPSLSSIGPTQLRLPVNVEHCFPPPPFVPGKEVNIVNNSISTQQLFCPPLSIPNNPDIVTKHMKAEYKETMVNIVKKWTESRNSFGTSKSKSNQFLKVKVYFILWILPL